MVITAGRSGSGYGSGSGTYGNLYLTGDININSNENAIIIRETSDNNSFYQIYIYAGYDYKNNTISNKVIKIRGDIISDLKATDNCLTTRGVYLYLTNADSYFAGKGTGLIYTSLGSGAKYPAFYILLNNGATWYAPASVTSHDLNNQYSWKGGIVDLANTIDASGKQVVRSEAAGKSFTLNYEANSPDYPSDIRNQDALEGTTFRVKADDEGNTDKIILKGSGTYSNAPSINVAMVFDKSASSAKIKTASYSNIITVEDSFKNTYSASGGTLTVTGKEYTSVVDAGLTKLTARPVMSTSGSVYGAGSIIDTNSAGENGGAAADITREEAGPAMTAAKEGATASLGTVAAIRADNNDLMRRMGDLRFSKGKAGSWVRWYGGESEITGGVNYKYNAIQGGYDWDYDTKNGKWFLGVTVSNNVGGYSFANGDGGINNTMFGIYGSWLGKKGHYADLILKQGRMSNHFNLLDGADRYSGEYKADVTSLSAEYGYRMNLKNNYYLEPQAELTYGHISSADYQMTLNGGNGPDMHNGSVNSLIGRVGFNLGKETEKGNIYTKLSLAHEFNGDSTVIGSYSGTSRNNSSSGKDTWLEFGVGFNQQIGKNLNLYGELDKTTGSVVRNKWRGNIGLRWSF